MISRWQFTFIMLSLTAVSYCRMVPYYLGSSLIWVDSQNSEIEPQSLASKNDEIKESMPIKLSPNVVKDNLLNIDEPLVSVEVFSNVAYNNKNKIHKSGEDDNDRPNSGVSQAIVIKSKTPEENDKNLKFNGQIYFMSNTIEDQSQEEAFITNLNTDKIHKSAENYPTSEVSQAIEIKGRTPEKDNENKKFNDEIFFMSNAIEDHSQEVTTSANDVIDKIPKGNEDSNISPSSEISQAIIITNGKDPDKNVENLQFNDQIYFMNSTNEDESKEMTTTESLSDPVTSRERLNQTPEVVEVEDPMPVLKKDTVLDNFRQTIRRYFNLDNRETKEKINLRRRMTNILQFLKDDIKAQEKSNSANRKSHE